MRIRPTGAKLIKFTPKREGSATWGLPVVVKFD